MIHANLASVFLQLQNSGAENVRAALPQASQVFPQLTSGQAVTATIIARLSENLFLADIDGRQLQLKLPTAVAAGDTISLRLLRTDPQLVFRLLSRSPADANSAAPQAVLARPTNASGRLIEAEVLDPAGSQAESVPASRAAQPPAQLAPVVSPATPATNALASLSQGAQIIQAVLGEVNGSQTRQPSPANAAPLLPAVPAQSMSAQPEQLAAALRNAVVASGVFYESHLAAWVQGQHTLDDLRREPQSEWGAAVGESGDAENAARPGAQALPEQAPAMLRQQIDALESSRIGWQGPVWPHQTASLTIAEEAPRRGEEAEGSRWKTNLAIDLPRLGDVRAELAVRGVSLTIAISCGDQESARTLAAQLQKLDQGLRGAGLQPLALTVAGHA